MSLILDENEQFSLTANVVSTGYQQVVLKGLLVKRTANGTYVAPLIPQLFYGADGTQLGASWRQYLPTAGEQVILSRTAGGYPKVPKEDIYWRKVREAEPAEPVVAEAPVKVGLEVPSWVLPLAIGVGAVAVIGYFLWKR